MCLASLVHGSTHLGCVAQQGIQTFVVILFFSFPPLCDSLHSEWGCRHHCHHRQKSLSSMNGMVRCCCCCFTFLATSIQSVSHHNHHQPCVCVYMCACLGLIHILKRPEPIHGLSNSQPSVCCGLSPNTERICRVVSEFGSVVFLALIHLRRNQFLVFGHNRNCIVKNYFEFSIFFFGLDVCFFFFL